MQMYIPNRTPSPAAGAQECSGEFRAKRIGVREIWRFVRRSALTITLAALAGAGLALAYLSLVPPSFTATAQVMVESSRAPYFFNGPSMAPEPVSDDARVETQMEIIQSDRVASSVIQQLHLDQSREFAFGQSLLLLSVLNRIDLSAFAQSAENSLRQLLGATVVDDKEKKKQYVLEQFAKNLSVNRTGRSMVINVAFRSRDPVLASQVANAVIDAYQKEDIGSKSQAAEQSRDWLIHRLNELKQQSNESQLAVEQFKRTGFRADEGESQTRLYELQSVTQSQRRLYDDFLRKLDEVNQKVSFPEPDSRVIAAAAVPLRPRPARSLVLMFATLLGAALGAGISLARANSDRRIHSPNEIVAEVGVDCLGTVARLSPLRQRVLALRTSRPSPCTALVNLNHRRISPMLRTIIDHPTSSLGRDLRAIKTFINKGTMNAGPRTIGIVALQKGQGATTIASNLALLYAMSGERTLLVDACIEHPVISNEFAPVSQVGLMEALDNPDMLAGALDSDTQRSFTVLPVGKANTMATPGDRIASGATGFQLSDLKKKFSLVIVDLPAISESPDALAIAPYLDGIVVVVTPNSTTIDHLSRCVRSLNYAGVSLLGVIITKWEQEMEA